MVLAILLFCLIQRTACVWITNYEHINRRIMFIFKVQTVSNDRCLETLFCKWFVDDFAVLRPTECAASLPLTAQNRRRERRHCAGRVRPRVRGATLETSFNWTKAKVFSEKSLGFKFQVSSFKFYLSHTRLYRDCITSSEMRVGSAPWTVQILKKQHKGSKHKIRWMKNKI